MNSIALDWFRPCLNNDTQAVSIKESRMITVHPLLGTTVINSYAISVHNVHQTTLSNRILMLFVKNICEKLPALKIP